MSGGRERLGAAFAKLAERARAGERLTIVLVNDVGFVGGAGKALRRQAQSFLIGGHRVGVVCGLAQAAEAPNGQGLDLGAGWLGLRALPETCPPASGPGSAPAAVTASVLAAIEAWQPDLVLSGNFHWFRWPLAILAGLAERGVPSVAYLHDMHWVSGRCAYAGTCRKYIDGCDAACPTPNEYPSLAPERIAAAWSERRQVFVEGGVPLAANSRWMAERAREGFGPRATVVLQPLALDARRFAPIDRGVARRLLGLPEAPTVLVGAIDMADRRKGGHLLRDVVPRLQQAGVQVIAFGHNSQYLPGARGLGFIEDERVMPVVLAASDLFLNVSLEESFGQTLMEAAACGVPSVAIARGGIPDIARHEVNAILVDREAPEVLAAAVLDLLADRFLRERLGVGGRRLVEAEFTLEAQAKRWQEWLARGGVGAASERAGDGQRAGGWC